jgi:hypothetical protein
MRLPLDTERLEAFMIAMGRKTTSPGIIYFTGGATALLYGWRPMTIDVDIKADPEPKGFFESIFAIKNELSLNVELASPSDFIPELPNWRSRSRWIKRYGEIDYYHYDFYSQALAKLERGHARDLCDVKAMVDLGLIEKSTLLDLFSRIEADLIRYPAIDAIVFHKIVHDFCSPNEHETA